ncbi:septal ring lytic transglycosylase RlpA family protein [Bartonella bacilliformis]|uniref:septal ring lytic transglycosylase RlpA family protein n=1 Tax=Bartonella bacilliformis TaxID=774 RepID=UPI0004A12BC5|nr:septal ring lytic transglycosylase RlpA family protein [Bartonella bacilliformis]KEG16860.1 hypothetical protein H705_00747 [Bartonella bacilliformis Cond044]
MFLKSKKKLTSIIKLAFQFFFIIATAGLLTACASKTTQLAVKDSKDNKTSGVMKIKKSSVSPKPANQQNKSKNKNKQVSVGKPYKIKGKWYYPEADPNYKRVGQASWYGEYFHGRLTANGEIYDMNLLTAAHTTLPLPSYVRVTNLKNASSIIVRVNDRGPYMKNRIIDLSKQAAIMLGFKDDGIVDVKVEYVSEAPINKYDGDYLMASYKPGNYTSLMMLALADIEEKKKDTVSLALNGESQKKLTKVVINQKKSSWIKLPEIGPILVDKPISSYTGVFL